MTNTNSEAVFIDLLTNLLERASVTPEDAGCQLHIADFLSPLGFVHTDMSSGEVTNLLSVLDSGNPGEYLAFVGHTDVVPAGDLNEWTSDPFVATRTGDRLRARGTVDMKGSIAAAMIAISEIITEKGQPKRGKLGIMLTSDEEGEAIDGIKVMVEKLQSTNELPDWALIGEPSSKDRVGDRVRIGRRGSLNGNIRVAGTQGHVAYPEKITNSCAQLARWIEAMANKQWDSPQGKFPATSFQVTALTADSGAVNVTPSQAHARFNLRFSPKFSGADLAKQIEDLAQELQIDAEFEWRYNAEPFSTPAENDFIQTVASVLNSDFDISTELSCSGGTSDGRYIAPLGVAVCELGPVAVGLHEIDEDTSISELLILKDIYKNILLKIHW